MLSDDEFVRLFQERAGLNPDGWPGRDTLSMLDQVLPARPSPALTETTQALPADYFPLLAQIESGNQPYIKASSSSASGLYQFVKSTWEEQLARAKTFTGKNAVYLRRKTIPINKASLYAAHFLGAVTAAKVIGADPAASAEALAGPAATAANPTILRGKTVGQFLTWLHGKTGDWAR
jgi:hypothetical protein